jgi:putative transposase
MDQATTKAGKEAVLTWLETNKIPRPVDIISLCLMPNHYHLTLEQKVENGIPFYMHKIGLSYTNYFNIRLERTGRLFESTYKDVLVETDEQLLHLTRYHHINPHELGLETVEELIEYPWSSLSTYVNGPNPLDFLTPDRVTNMFQDPDEYKKFVSAEIDEFEPVRLESVAIDDDFGWFRKFRNQKKAQQKEMRELYMRMLSE